jgi:hypothetical protein
MSSKNSNRLKCRHCEIINWSTDQFCRRCHQPLAKPSAHETGAELPAGRFQLYFFIYIAAIIAPILVGRAEPAIGAGLALCCIVAAWIIALYCSVALLVDMFRVSVVWGLAGIFLSPISTLIYLGMYWDRSKRKFLTSLAMVAYWVIIFIGMNQLVKPEVVQNKSAAPSAPVTNSADRMPPSKTNFVPQKSPVKK